MYFFSLFNSTSDSCAVEVHQLIQIHQVTTMTIKDLLEGKQVKWIEVNVIEALSPTRYIVADTTGVAIMEVTPDHSKYVEVGKGVKLVKPSKVSADEIANDKRFSPMKTKAKVIKNPNSERVTVLRNKPKLSGNQAEYVEFKTIKNEFKESAIVGKILAYVVNVSRVIDGNFGKYRIVSLRDSSSEQLTLGLYEPHVEKLQDNQVYAFTKLKKTVLKTDGSIRLGTTKFTQIVKGSEGENELFINIQVAESVIEGGCIMISNFSGYKSCPTHATKLDEDGECLGCRSQIDPNNAVNDFYCVLQVDNGDDIESILAFRRLFKKIQLDIDALEDSLEKNIVGKRIKIHYNTKDDENKTNIAVKIDIVENHA